MWKDPIVEEVRRTREMLAARFNFDIKAISGDARRRQALSGHKIVSLKPRRPIGWIHPSEKQAK
jgi:hypothetical protein